MITYLIRRIAAALVLLFVVSVITFSIFYLVPRLAGASAESLATRYVGRAATAETVALTAERLGFNDPIYVQYANWAKGIFVGAEYDMGAQTVECPAPCLGYSFLTKQAGLAGAGRPSARDVLAGHRRRHHLGGLRCRHRRPLGAETWVGLRPRGHDRGPRRGLDADLLDRPDGAEPVQLPVGDHRARWLLHAVLREPGAWAYDLLLPWTTLALLFSAQYARLTRAGMLETMGEDYIRTARAKGLKERRVVVKHGLRGALTPILTIFGLDFGLLIGGAILTERVFSLNGLGAYAVQGIFANDLPKIMGVTLLAAFFVVIASLVVDLLYAVVDPRVRTK